VIHTVPKFKYPSDKRFFFTDPEAKPIGGGLALWRGYFQSVRPAIDHMLINLDTSITAMYRSGELIDLALELLDKPGIPNALAPRRGFPDRERLRLQRFVTGIKVAIRRADRQLVIKRLTKEGARDLTFEVEDGKFTTVANYLQSQWNIRLQFPDVICAEVCITFVLSSRDSSLPVALDRRPHPFGALQSSTGSDRS
jgi:eukaryotic translation initiation factor 2C